MAVKVTLPRAFGVRSLRRREELSGEMKARLATVDGAAGNGGRPKPSDDEAAQTWLAEIDIAEVARDANELAAIERAHAS